MLEQVTIQVGSDTFARGDLIGRTGGKTTILVNGRLIKGAEVKLQLRS